MKLESTKRRAPEIDDQVLLVIQRTEPTPQETIDLRYRREAVLSIQGEDGGRSVGRACPRETQCGALQHEFLRVCATMNHAATHRPTSPTDDLAFAR